jgi:hypothetical protein
MSHISFCNILLKVSGKVVRLFSSAAGALCTDSSKEAGDTATCHSNAIAITKHQYCKCLLRARRELEKMFVARQ